VEKIMHDPLVPSSRHGVLGVRVWSWCTAITCIVSPPIFCRETLLSSVALAPLEEEKKLDYFFHCSCLSCISNDKRSILLCRLQPSSDPSPLNGLQIWSCRAPP
jgi:hypothetical protein